MKEVFPVSGFFHKRFPLWANEMQSEAGQSPG
jgi:hypothetical protein